LLFAVTKAGGLKLHDANVRVNTAKVDGNVMTLEIDYAYKTAEALDADYSMVSFSGYGIVSGYTGEGVKSAEQLVPMYYEKLGFSYGTYFGNETYRIVDLGTYEKGDTVTVRLELKKDNLYIWDSGYYFWQTNADRFKYAMEKLSASQFEITKHTDTQLLGTIDVAGDQTQIFTSIPYDEGWRIICDGEEVSYAKGADALITFELPEGEHDLRLEYSPDCFKYGVIISVAGLLAAVLMGASEILARKNTKKED